jgi:hypothetical protein
MLAQLLWHSLNMLPLVIALGAALVVAVVWLYPAQVRRVKWPWRWVLPGLRAIGLLVLCTALLQPAASRLRNAEERPAVIVLIDHSKSMSVTDIARSPSELVALADGLGRLPAGARTGATNNLGFDLDQLREDVARVVSAGHDVETAEAFGRGIEAARSRLANVRAAFTTAAADIAARAASLPEAGELRPRLLALGALPDNPSRDAWAADARSRIDAARVAVSGFQATVDQKLYESNPAVKSVCDELAKMSRWSLAEQALLQPKRGLVSRLASDMPVLGYLVGEGITPVVLTQGGNAPAALAGNPDSGASNLAGSIASAIAAVGERPVRAIVLLSDGRHVGKEASIVSVISPSGAPVFTVGVASERRTPDLSFSREVSIPASAFVGETISVRAPINAVGSPAPATDVQLKSGDSVQYQRIELKPDGTSTPAEFSVRLEHGGLQRIVINIPPAPGEITTANNTIERWVKVLPERMKVAAFAGTPGWDFQLLRSTLASTPWAQLESGVLDSVEPKFPLTPEQILRQDVIILSDVSASSLSDVQWDAVNRLVRERGGSLFLLAGPDHLPASYTPANIVASALLPYDVKTFSPSWRTWPGEQAAFRLVPANQLGAERAAALRIGTGNGSLRNWQGMPGAFRFIPVAELEGRMNVRPLLVEADSRLPVLTEGFPGNGRVFFLGSNETWRWRNKVGSRDFERFWLQLIRYAAGEPYAVTGDTLALDADKAAPSPAEPINIRARILRDDSNDFRIQVLRDGQIIQDQNLSPVGSNSSGRFSATVSDLEKGDYLIRLKNSADAKAESAEMALRVVASDEAELADVSGDASLLHRIADASGGQFLTLDRFSQLPRLLTTIGDTRSKYAEWSLWDSPLLFVFVVACFGAEWALRKRVGLA